MTMLLAKREIIGGVRMALMDGLSTMSSIFSVVAGKILQAAGVDSESLGDDIAPYVGLLMVSFLDGRVCGTNLRIHRLLSVDEE